MRKRIDRIAFSFFLDYIFVFLVVYFSRSMWLSIPSLIWIDRFFKVLFFIVTLCQVLFSKEIRITKSRVAIIVCLCGYFLLFSVIRPINIQAYLTTVYLLLLVVTYVWCKKADKVAGLLYKYERIIILIAGISLFFWIFGSVLKIVHPSGSIETTWSGTDDLLVLPTYYYLYFEPRGLTVIQSVSLLRNIAVFTEAPMCSFHVVVALLIELFIQRKSKRVRLFILLAALITTISMTGYICASIAFFAKYVYSKNNNHRLIKVIKYASIPLAILILAYLVRMFLSQRSNTGSGNIRIDDFRAGYKAWMDNILFGNGYGNAESYIKYMSAFRIQNRGFSNSVMQLLAYGGLYLFMPFLLAIIYGIRSLIHDRNKLSLMLIFLLMYTFTVVPYQPISILIFAWFTSQITDKRTVLIERYI